MTLFEQSEFGIFRDKRSGLKDSDSYPSRSRFESFFAYLLGGPRK